ncbi:MAG: hypothetical protein CVU54_15075 [Deltaproteobacteria bacterium HGW-Deltaproteobacteria-12]|jgi:hypothetical protein|nr:MAG: hypothetical protein CVU54_15075 [Deltaproteobacteria bacterium HGW-Deltaproteobacteria-12]
MSNFYKKYLILAILILLCLAPGSILAYSTQITVDGKDDAGIYPGQNPIFTRFVQINNSQNVLREMSSLELPLTHATQSTQSPSYSLQNAYYYAWLNGINDWTLESAGNIWSSDATVGESLSGLSAGTYRISPLSGAYMYVDDAFEWGGGYQHKYWWKVFVIATDSAGYNHDNPGDARGYIFGPGGAEELDVSSLLATPEAYDWYAQHADFSGAYDSSTDAFNAVQNLHLDISLEEGGGLYFWIWDWNSIDNSGAISLNVTSVPEPSTLILLAIGLSCLIIRSIRSAASRRSSVRVYVKK